MASTAAVAADNRNRKPTRRCTGVAKRRCSEQSDPRSKRCSECQAEHMRLKKREHNSNYYQDHGGQLNERRRKRRKREKVIALLQALAEAGGLPPTRPAKRSQTKKARRRGHPSLSDAEKLDRKKRLAMSIFVRVRVEGEQPHEAWYSTHPRSTASQETAAREANRLIRWYLREFPLDMKSLLDLHGFDWDALCQLIKKLLSATRYYQGEPTDLPDWDARIRGLKLLMTSLDLATPIGFRSGPRALEGALEYERIRMNGAGEPPVHDPVEDPVRKLRAGAIVLRHCVEGKRLSDCWKEVCPSSDANPRSAAKKAQADIRWYKARYSQSFEQRLAANGLDTQTVVKGILELRNAGKVLRGALTDDPDWLVRTKGRDLLMVLHGYRHPHGRTPSAVSMISIGGHRAQDAV